MTELTAALQSSASSPVSTATNIANSHLSGCVVAPIVYWLRADIRWLDNPALHAAYQHAQQLATSLVVVYVHSPQQWQQHGYGTRRMALEQQALVDFEFSINNLSKAATAAVELTLLTAGASANNSQEDCAAVAITLQQLNSPLYTTLPTDLVAWCSSIGATELYANRQYEYNEVMRDRALHSCAKKAAINCYWFEDQCIVPPAQVLKPAAAKQVAQPYKVFTAYKKRVLAMLLQQPSSCLPSPLLGTVSANALRGLELQALDALQDFVNSEPAARYNDLRNFPALDATSKLSAYLAVGLVSTRQCLVAWLQAGHALESQWVAELLWRDYYRYVMCHFPHVGQGRNFSAFSRPIAWRNNTIEFSAWCEGQTGYPIVDAAMRCLNATGLMHNRLRMIVAMFLCKHLQIDWRWGEAYFLQQLQDADYASNNGGWQWCAGTGVDAAPYFRIFNPTTQSEKFDADGTFISQWLPELATLPRKAIHAPYVAGILANNPALANYPRPIVEHGAARAACLAMYKQAKAGAVAALSNTLDDA